MPMSPAKSPAAAWRAGLLALLLSPAAFSQPANAPAWWTVFRETPLNLLLAPVDPPGQDGGRGIGSQAEISSQYLQARVHAARLHIAWQLQDVAEQWLASLAAGDPSTGASADSVRHLLEEVRTRATGFEDLRAGSVRKLSVALGGARSVAWLEEMLEPALEERRLPLPVMTLPESVSGLALRRRVDVSHAEQLLAQDARGLPSEQLRLARYLQAIASDIGPVQPGQTRPARSASAPPEDVLDNARREVGERLWQLGVAMEAMRRQDSYLRELSASHAATAARHVGQDRDKAADLSSLAILLVEEDRLAAAAGAAGLAWVALQASMGGAGATRTADLIGWSGGMPPRAPAR